MYFRLNYRILKYTSPVLKNWYKILLKYEKHGVYLGQKVREMSVNAKYEMYAKFGISFILYSHRPVLEKEVHGMEKAIQENAAKVVVSCSITTVLEKQYLIFKILGVNEAE